MLKATRAAGTAGDGGLGWAGDGCENRTAGTQAFGDGDGLCGDGRSLNVGAPVVPAWGTAASRVNAAVRRVSPATKPWRVTNRGVRGGAETRDCLTITDRQPSVAGCPASSGVTPAEIGSRCA